MKPTNAKRNIKLKYGDKVIVNSDAGKFNAIFHSAGSRFGMTKVYCLDGNDEGNYRIYQSYKVESK